MLEAQGSYWTAFNELRSKIPHTSPIVMGTFARGLVKGNNCLVSADDGNFPIVLVPKVVLHFVFLAK